MKYLYLAIAFFTCKFSYAQQNFPVHEQFIDIYQNNSQLPVICVDRDEGIFDAGIVGVAINKVKYQALAPKQSVGNLIVFKKNLFMSNPDRWQFTIEGNACAYDIISTSRYRTIVVGAFEDSIRVNGQTYIGGGLHFSSFVLSLDSMGNIEWIKTNYNLNQNWIATSVVEDEDKNLVVVGLKDDIYSIVWKYNALNGDTILVKSFDEVRTFSSVKSIKDHYYISGTVDDFGSLDTFTINNPLNTGYNIFLAKLDKQFNVQWLITKPYITFDFHSELETADFGESTLLWANYSLNNTSQLVQNLCIIDTNKNILNEQNYNSAFTSFEFDNKLIESSALNLNSYHYIKEKNNDYYMYLFGPNGISDSLLIFKNSDIELYDFEGDHSFALAGLLKGDSLRSQTARVPNIHADSNKYMNFIGYYTQAVLLGANNSKLDEVYAYPNPVEDKIYINSSNAEELILLDMNGRDVKRNSNLNYISVYDLDTGMYILKIKVAGRYLYQKILKK